MLSLELTQKTFIVTSRFSKRFSKFRDVHTGADRSSHVECYVANSVHDQILDLHFPQLLIFVMPGAHILSLQLH